MYLLVVETAALTLMVGRVGRLAAIQMAAVVDQVAQVREAPGNLLGRSEQPVVAVVLAGLHPM